MPDPFSFPHLLGDMIVSDRRGAFFTKVLQAVVRQVSAKK
jgi:hypothetical protein